MDYEKIMIVCGVITFIMAGITIWARIQKHNEIKIHKIKEEERTVVNETNIDINKNDIASLKEEVRKLVDEKRNISRENSEFSEIEKEKLFREKVKYSSNEVNELIKKSKAQTKSYVLNAMGFELDNKYEKAIYYYEKALEETTFHDDKAWILYSLGNIYFDNKDYKKAISDYKKAIIYYNQVDKKDDNYFLILGDIYSCLGIIYRDQNNYKEAIKNHEKALKLRENLVLKDHDKYILEVSKSYNNLAVVYKHQGDFDKSIDFNEKSINIRKDLADKTNSIIDKYYIARAICNLGNVYRERGDYLKSKERIETAIRLINDLESNLQREVYCDNLSMFYLNYSYVLGDLNEYEESENIIKKDLLIIEELEDKTKKAQYFLGALLNLSIAKKGQGEINEAIKTLEQALKYYKDNFNKTFSNDIVIVSANIYFNLGDIYYNNKRDYELALMNFEKSYSIYSDYPNSAYARKWAGIASKYIASLK